MSRPQRQPNGRTAGVTNAIHVLLIRRTPRRTTTEQYRDLFEVLIWIGQERKNDVVLGKALRVLSGTHFSSQ